MKLKLKVIGGKHAGQEIAVPTSRPFLFGRGEDCHLRAGSELVSRHHCVLLVDGQSVFVRDLSSRNGTFINGERVSSEQELADGDQLAIGPLKFAVICCLPSALPVAVDVAAGKVAARPDEFDVSEWLSDAADEASALTQTQCMRSSDTQAIDTAVKRPNDQVDATADETPPAAAEAASESAPAVRSKKPVVGKLPPIPSKITADSRDAAAQMLQKLRRKSV